MPEALLRIRCSPGARRPGLAGRHGQAWKVRVAAAPEKGRANAELLALLARALDLPKEAVTLVRGATSRDKQVRVEGLSTEEVERRLGGA